MTQLLSVDDYHPGQHSWAQIGIDVGAGPAGTYSTPKVYTEWQYFCGITGYYQFNLESGSATVTQNLKVFRAGSYASCAGGGQKYYYYFARSGVYIRTGFGPYGGGVVSAGTERHNYDRVEPNGVACFGGEPCGTSQENGLRFYNYYNLTWPLWDAGYAINVWSDPCYFRYENAAHYAFIDLDTGGTGC